MGQSSKQSAVTILDVAKHSGVSYSTVSRVANGYEFVKPATRERVQKAMDELGYVANLKARSLAGGRSNMIGLLVFDLEDKYFTEVVRGIDSEASKLNYDMVISTTHQRLDREKAYISQLTSGIVDGLIIMLPQNIDEWLTPLRQRNVPYVLIDHESGLGQGNIIRTANRRGAVKGTNHLIKLGHTRIGLIAGTQSVQSGRERVEGFRQAFAEHQLDVDESLILQGDFDEISGYECGLELLKMASRPTAIFALNDEMAIGVYRAAEELGISIPDQLSVVGFDDIPEVKYLRPNLTTVHQPKREIGKRATQLLVEMIEDKGEKERELQTITLDTELIERQSTARAG